MKKSKSLRNLLLGAGVGLVLTLNGCGQADARSQTRMEKLEAQIVELESRLESLDGQSRSISELEATVAQLEQRTSKLQRNNDELASENVALKRNAKRDADKKEAAPAGSLKQVNLTDISGKYGETEIKLLAQLGVLPNEGEFSPNADITRGEFVRWLVSTNNRYANLELGRREVIRLAEHDNASFQDVSPDHPDFPYIQGMVDSGFVIGYDATTFAPDRPLSREELIAIKSAVDWNQELASDHLMSDQAGWSDSDQISKKYYGAFANDRYLGHPNIQRTFGSIRAFRPHQAVNRAEAAKCLTAISGHNYASSGPGNVTAEQAVAKAASQ